MERHYFLGIDFGTGGVRCGIVDSRGDFVVVKEKKYNTIYPKAGYAEQSPSEWIDSVEQAIAACGK